MTVDISLPHLFLLLAPPLYHCFYLYIYLYLYRSVSASTCTSFIACLCLRLLFPSVIGSTFDSSRIQSLSIPGVSYAAEQSGPSGAALYNAEIFRKFAFTFLINPPLCCRFLFISPSIASSISLSIGSIVHSSSRLPFPLPHFFPFLFLLLLTLLLFNETLFVFLCLFEHW